MSDNKKNAFSQYSSNIQPKNITSDMWQPITSNGNFTAFMPEDNIFEPVKKASEKKKAPVKSVQNTVRPSNGRVQGTKKTGSRPIAPKKAPKPQPEKVADRPISSGPVTEKKKARSSKTKKTNKQSKNNYLKKIILLSQHSKRDKANKSFLRLVRNGKNVEEARRLVVRRKRLRRNLSTFLSVVLAFMFGAIFVLSYTYFEGAPVKEIVITGDEVYPETEILDAAQLAPGVNMLTVKEKNVNEKVTGVLPFISAIGVDYKLPDVLELNIVSTTERFIIKNGKNYICVDKTGKVVSEKKKKLSEGQFMVLGLEEQEYTVGENFAPSGDNANKVAVISELAFAAENLELLKYGVINVEDMNDITFTYKSRLRVYLGDGSNIASKLSKAEDVIKQNNAQEKTGYVNVKYDIGAYFMQGSMEA